MKDLLAGIGAATILWLVFKAIQFAIWRHAGRDGMSGRFGHWSEGE